MSIVINVYPLTEKQLCWFTSKSVYIDNCTESIYLVNCQRLDQPVAQAKSSTVHK